MWSFLLGGKRKHGKNNAQANTARTGRRVSQRMMKAAGPPLTDEELNSNLSELERRLNEQMRCPAGKNQVCIRSVLGGSGQTRPRIMLRCPLRRDVGLEPEVYYEHIRDVCCRNPDQCPAYQAFKDRFTPT